MSWRELVAKAMRSGVQYRFTEVVDRVEKLAQKEGYGYTRKQVKGSVAFTLGNGLKSGDFTRPDRGVYIRN